ncbi:hypothetical protein GCM10010211_37020 [Streptomyces albospinus]|uniref:Uncharacterized protein n=1 Tax=Streptomyces albospinus TaxID=285515 RepID=A0ABQ2V6U3_9ACTN|nr:hypothetical protein [Streptomyces albospinus]GGU68310.1 hypothetical protein GCM10010211_37020 [Streptomyces albospinus]
MSDAPVDPAEVPVFTGDLALLETKAKALSRGGSKVQAAGSDVHKSFGGLSAFYKAPEAEQLFGVTKPVERTAHGLSEDMHVIAKALNTYAHEITPLVHQLKQLKQDAADFRATEAADDDWNEDGDLVEENLNRRNKIAEVWAAFQEAERDCHAKIVALVGGKALHTIDASHTKGYGYDAEALKQSKSLPWGDAVEESVPWWQVWEHAYDFGKGFIVDGVGGTIDGLYTLFGGHGGDAAGEAWKGLAKLSTAFTISTLPVVGQTYLMMPGSMLPSWLRDSRKAMLDTGKALVAWDQWESNGSRAAGAVTFNIVTAVFTRGGGAAVEGASKAGALGKGLSVVSKVGSAVDPMTYVIKGAGAGLSKVGDVMAHLKGLGHVEVPKISEGAYSLPEGAVKMPDGTVELPKGAAIPEGATKLPDGRIELPKDTVTFPPDTVKDPSTGKYMSGRGDLYNEDGSLFQRAEDAPKETPTQPAAGADNPRVEPPVRQEQPALVGVGGRGDDITRVGSDFPDPDRVGHNAGHGDTGPGDHSRMGRADDHGTPGGHAPDNMPRNDLNQHPRVGHGNSPTTHGTNAPSGGDSRPHGPGGGGTHPDTPSTGGTHNPLGGHGPGGFDDIPGFGDDAARGGDGTAPAGGREGQPTHPASGQQMTPEQVKARQDEFVQKANDPDKTWFNQYYRSDGHRLSIHTKIDGVELPILAKDSDGSWISKNSLPSAGSETKFGRDQFLRDETHPAIEHLDDVAKDRKASVELANAERAHKTSPTADTLDQLAKAQERFDTRMTPQWGENTSNNTSFSERLGEDAARLHVVPERFPGSVEQPLPKTPNGANMFDQLYRRPDGKLMIIEAKAPSSGLLWRKGVGPAEGFMVKQGTEPYLRTIIAEMQLRPKLKVTDASGKVWTNADLAKELKTALDDGNLEYAMVKATDGGGEYAGAVLEFFKI